MRRSFAVNTLLAVGLTTVASLGAQQPSSYSYDFRSSSDRESDGMTGTVRVSGNRARIDLKDRHGDKEYLLLENDGRSVTVVKPEDESYTTFTSNDFAHIASIGIGAIGKAITMKLRSSSFETEKLGNGEMIAGRHTEHVRVIEHSTMEVGIMGFSSPVKQTVETEYYYDPSLTLMRNPLIEIVGSTATVLPATDAGYAEKQDSVKRKFMKGMPLKTIIKNVSDTGKESRIVLEVTRYGATRVNEADLRIPAGYVRKDNGLGGFKVKL